MMCGPASIAVISVIKIDIKKLRLLVDLRILCSIYIPSFMINGSVVSEELR